MNKTTTKKTASEKTANLARNASSTADVTAENAAGQKVGLGADGKRTKRAPASNKETLFNSSPLATRMRDDLVLAGRSEETQISYLREMKKLAAHFNMSPDKITENDLRQYMLYLKNDLALEPNSLKVTHSAVKFFYRKTCVRDWPTLSNLKVQNQLKLPAVLALDETHLLIDTVRRPAMRCFFWTVYSLGLRMQEALYLQVTDIKSERMLVHVRRGKGAKDRLVPLPQKTLDMLREHWQTHHNPKWLFPAEGRNHKLAPTATTPMSESSPQLCIKKVVEQLGWANRGIATHTLRHCYATHLLEVGVNLRQIQKYLGHKYLTTTMIYLHLTTIGEEAAVEKINSLMVDRAEVKRG
jgi:site-specific recombinase XerD